MSVNALPQRSIAIVLLALFVGMSFSPFGELWIEQAEAAEVARHTYEFSDGTTEYIALYQGGNADTGAKIALPKGAQVTDVQMTLSGASATGWSSIPTTTRDHWVAGEATNTDNQSSDLTLAMANSSHEFNAHGIDEEVNDTYQYVLDLRQRLKETCKVASEQLKKSQVKQKHYFNLKAKPRQLKKEDEVLLLLPTDHKKLVIKWKGSYKVTAQIEINNYAVQLKGSVKIYHINMLKQYFRPEEDIHHVAVAAATFEDDETDEPTLTTQHPDIEGIGKTRKEETYLNVNINPELEDKKQEVTKLIKEFKIFYQNRDLPT